MSILLTWYFDVLSVHTRLYMGANILLQTKEEATPLAAIQYVGSSTKCTFLDSSFREGCSLFQAHLSVGYSTKIIVF